MREDFSAEDKRLLELLSDELQKKTEIKHYMPTELKNIFARADKHQVLAVLSRQMEELPDVDKTFWQTKMRRAVLQSYHLLFTAKYVVNLLEENGIRCVLLKGATVANNYPIPELRKSGDVDILLLDSRQNKQVENLLKTRGFQKSGEQHGSHHTVWFSPEKIEVEIHTRLTEVFNNEAANKKMEEQFKKIPEHITRKELMGISFPVLKDGFQAYHLLLHMLVHYMHSGFGLRLLCDWVAFWTQNVEKEEKKIYQSLVEETGLQGFSDRITSVCVYFLGLKNPELGEMAAREKAELFLKDVLEAEEFGTSDSDRLILLEKTGLSAYVKEFHHQMKLNYPKAQNCVILWPFLWAGTLGRFLVNNRKLRKTTSWKILKKTHERSSKISDLQLFQMKQEKR